MVHALRSGTHFDGAREADEGARSVIRVALISVLLAACGGSAPPAKEPAATPTEPTSDRTPEGLKATAAKLRDTACACADRACANAASDQLASWQASVGTPMSSDPAVEQQLQLAVQSIHDCIQKNEGT